MNSPSDKPVSHETVLVLGGRGFVGSHVVRKLIVLGHHPCLFGPPMQQDLLADIAGQFDERPGDIRDIAQIKSAMAESGARAIVNTAAHSVGLNGMMRSSDADADNALAVNVAGFRNLLDAALHAGVRRVVWTSSTVVYGQADDYPQHFVDEDAPSAPLTFYGLTKQMSEDTARYYRNRFDLDVTGLRLPLVLGNDLWYQGAASALMELMRAAKIGVAHRVSFHDELIDLMHVSDVADAVLDVLFYRGETRDIYNINGFAARLTDILGRLEKKLGRLNIDVDIQSPTLHFPLINDRRFRETLGFQPAYGLAELVDSFLE